MEVNAVASRPFPIAVALRQKHGNKPVGMAFSNQSGFPPPAVPESPSRFASVAGFWLSGMEPSLFPRLALRSGALGRFMRDLRFDEPVSVALGRSGSTIHKVGRVAPAAFEPEDIREKLAKLEGRPKRATAADRLRQGVATPPQSRGATSATDCEKVQTWPPGSRQEY